MNRLPRVHGNRIEDEDLKRARGWDAVSGKRRGGFFMGLVSLRGRGTDLKVHRRAIDAKPGPR